MHLHISHETVYDYDAPLARSTQYLRLTPRPSRRMTVLHWRLELPAPASACQDAFGNTMHVLSLDGRRRDIVLRAIGEVDTGDAPPAPDPEDELPAPLFLRDSVLTRADDRLRHFAAGFSAAAKADPHSADVDESSFRYPGPKPQTKEAGILMLADAVESASRVLVEPTPSRIESLVEDISRKRLLDGQFDECGLTLEEVWELVDK